MTNKHRAWLHKNRDHIGLMAWLDERSVDGRELVDVRETRIDLHDRAKKANFNLVGLTTFVVEQRTENADNERSYKVDYKPSQN